MNPLLQKLRNNQPTIGGWISFSSSYVAELMAGLGYDWVAVDWEHGAINSEAVQQMLQALRAGGMPSLVRIPEHAFVQGQQALDMGAGGIIVPMVQNADEAREVVAALRFPPVGRRSIGLGRWRFVMDAGDPSALNDEIVVVVMIECAEAVDDIENIMAVDGIDAFFIGPSDLAASLGYADGPRLEAAITHILEAGLRRRRVIGIHTHTPQDARRRIEQGFRLVALAEAGRMIQHTGSEFLKSARTNPV